MKNNNPGNIRLINPNATKFVGEVRPGNNGFRVFDSPINGYRAMFSLLKYGYIDKGKNTIAKILPVYAPAGDNNNPDIYIDEVSNATGIDRDTTLSTFADLLPVVKAMARVETGQDANDSDVHKALNTIYNPLLIITNDITSAPDGSPGQKNFFQKYKQPILFTGVITLVALYEHYHEKKKIFSFVR